MMWEIILAAIFAASVFILLYKAHTRQKDEAAIKELQRQTEKARQREEHRLQSMIVRPYQRATGTATVR